MEDTKKQEIKDIINERYDEEKVSLCKDIMEGFIFGAYGDNQHYSIDEISSIYDEVYLEKNPLPVIEEVIEEPIIEEEIIVE